MKSVLMIVLLFVSTLFYAQEHDTRLNWETDFEIAKTKSKKSKKPILMLFTGSDWCAPCKMLKKDFFYSDKFITKSKNFVLLMVDFPRNKDLITPDQEVANKVLNSKYGVRSLPIIIAVNHKGQVIDKIKSYNSSRDTRYHFQFIDKLLK
ncbi:MAG: thioredoxin family protein [Flavobacteriaceae bacterium]|nr:thioredoxin family protein [Flavobacteriaceae bacterium]